MHLSNRSIPPETQHDNTVTIYTKSQNPQFENFNKLLEEVDDRKVLKMKDKFKKANASMLNQNGELKEHTRHTKLCNIYFAHSALNPGVTSMKIEVVIATGHTKCLFCF
jgi:hypothetical protein